MLAFYCYHKIPKKINVEEEKILLHTWLCQLWSRIKKFHLGFWWQCLVVMAMVRNTSWSKLLLSETGKQIGPQYHLSHMAPVT